MVRPGVAQVGSEEGGQTCEFSSWEGTGRVPGGGGCSGATRVSQEGRGAFGGWAWGGFSRGSVLPPRGLFVKVPWFQET